MDCEPAHTRPFPSSHRVSSQSGFLIIVTIVMTVMVLLGSLYVLVYFQAEEDKNTAIAPKIAVVLGLALSCLLVLTLPLDVANRSTMSGLDMETLWQAEYVVIAIMAIGVVPFLIFYYEAEDPEGRSYQWWTAMKYEFVTVVVALTCVLLAWLLAGYAEVPIVDYTYEGSLLDAAAPSDVPSADRALTRAEHVLKVSVTPVTWIMALLSFVGWFFLVLFGGIGMAALPMDLLVDYTTRPQSIDLQVRRALVALSIESCGNLYTARLCSRRRSTQSRRCCSTSARSSCSTSPRPSGPTATVRAAARGGCSTTSSSKQSTSWRRTGKRSRWRTSSVVSVAGLEPRTHRRILGPSLIHFLG
eukprot:Transcript_26542.p1 GENE.Transcript_26542~~Transcript_26542.p1  ORF type:complete len:358 (+),score=45.92 Transcript_26542:113-1186(+)